MSSPEMPKADPPPRDQRDAILSAAIEILHSNGAGALTVRSVASAAGCSTTGVYTYFGGKNGLVEAIFIDGFQRFGVALEVARASAPPDGPVDVMAQAYRDWGLANPTHYMVMFGRGVPDLHPSPEALAIAGGTFEQLVDATITMMAKLGISGEPRELAHYLWAGMHGYVSLEIANMDRITDPKERQRRFDLGLRRLVRGCLPAN
jgi:AcrR family transcriptional regulator